MSGRSISKSLLTEIMSQYGCSMSDAIEIYKCEELWQIEKVLDDIHSVLFSVTGNSSHNNYLSIDGSVSTYEQ